MLKHEGAGRVRLSNGRRMSYRSFRESMAEQYPEPNIITDEPDPDFDRLVVQVRDIQSDLDMVKRRLLPAAALERARFDAASGQLLNERTEGIRHHASEGRLWN